MVHVRTLRCSVLRAGEESCMLADRIFLVAIGLFVVSACHIALLAVRAAVYLRHAGCRCALLR